MGPNRKRPVATFIPIDEQGNVDETREVETAIVGNLGEGQNTEQQNIINEE